MKRRRYYSDEDIEHGVTPSRLKKLGRAKQIEYIKHWFFRNFEDPANETPYNSQEGGYLYIWGGPYDALDEIGNEFGDLVSQEVIEEAVNEVQRDGIYDWAPGTEHPDQRQRQEEWEAEQQPELEPDIDLIIENLKAGIKPNYGAPHELAEREAILDRLAQLETTLEGLRPRHGGLGHNNPPDDDETDTAGVLSDVNEASKVIREELSKAEPDALAVGLATSRLRTLVTWFGKKFDIAADAFAKAVGDSAGKATGVAAVGLAAYAYSPVGKIINDVVSLTTQWLQNVTMPF